MPIVSILVLPANATIPQAGTQQFIATAIDNQGNTSDVTATATWVSTDVTVATVSAAGLATGVGPGAVTIQATADGLTGEAVLGVEVTLASISIDPTDAVIDQGEALQFAATGHYSDASSEDLTQAATWVSTNLNVASIDTAGLVTARAGGVTVIEARYGSVVEATSLGVIPAGATPTTCEQMLEAARRQLFLQAAGQAPLAVETPQLGRVVYQQTSIADLQRLIDQLEIACHPESARAIRRRPISVEACP